MDGIQGLKDKIAKDAQGAERRIGELQKKIQSFVQERKAEKARWEAIDLGYSRNIEEALSELSEVQGRMFAGQEIIELLTTKL